MDLGLATDDAWRRFRHELADRMADLHSEGLVEVAGEPLVNHLGFECTPRVHFSRDGEVVFGSITGDCVHAKAGVGKNARRRLMAIGWYKDKAADGVVEFRAEVDVSHADVLAAMTVAALREVFEVAHPASLTGDVTMDESEYGYGDAGCVVTGPLDIDGTSANVEDETDEENRTSMMTLLQLDADRPRSISPAMAAHICGNDPERLLRLITTEEEQEIEWLKARDEARDDDDSEELADVCEHERAHAERSVKLLREALRYVVERDFHRSCA
jgi:hypothetical protein